MDIGVRDARPRDADEIAAAHIASWRAAYAHIFPSTIFDDPEFDESRYAMWRAWSRSPTADGRLIVAVAGDRTVGFAHTGHAEPAATGQRWGELYAFYTHPDAWGSGAASALMAAALDHLASLGHGRAILWTFSDAHRARRFYEKTGWEPTGEVDIWSHHPEAPTPSVEYEHAL